MPWTIVDIGRFKGKAMTLPQIVWHNPEWFLCTFDTGKVRAPLAAEAEVVAERARYIKIPQKGDERRIAEYGMSKRTGEFSGLEIVPADWPLHEGSTACFRKAWIDLGFTNEVCNYSRISTRLLVRHAKHILFGDGRYRMTRDRAEAFFDDDRNFVFTDVCR